MRKEEELEERRKHCKTRARNYFTRVFLTSLTSDVQVVQAFRMALSMLDR